MARGSGMIALRRRLASCAPVVLAFAALWLAAACPLAAQSEGEIALFNRAGRAEAYIAIDDELTIYLWSGKPVAYLDRGVSGEIDVYGFNGEHLGWFESGILWDHDGYGLCATGDALPTHGFEPFKAFKQFKPFKALKRLAPLRPTFKYEFGNVPCAIGLAMGRF